MDQSVFDDARLTAVGLLRETCEGLESKLDVVHNANGLSGSDFDTLIRLARSPGARLRMSDLAAQTSLSTSGMTRIVDRLERLGFLARASSPGDRRGSFAVLTDAGRDRLTAELPALLDEIDRWFTGVLSTEQLQTLLSLLQVVRDSVRPGAAAGAVG